MKKEQQVRALALAFSRRRNDFVRKSKIWLLRILLLVAVGVFVFAAGKLLQIYLEYKRGADTYEELQEYVQEPQKQDEKESEKVDKPEELESPYLQVDLEGLKAENPDVVAWIQIPALDISYPVVQGTDNYYYLHHMFNGESNTSGSIFVDYHNSADFTDSNTIVYGHNMKDKTMFGRLDGYQEQALYQQYPCFYIYIPGYVMEYQIVSCYAGRNGSVGYTYGFPTPEEFQDFLDKILSYAGYDTGTEVTTEDKIVTLSTCVNSNRNYRYLVHGKLVKKMEN